MLIKKLFNEDAGNLQGGTATPNGNEGAPTSGVNNSTSSTSQDESGAKQEVKFNQNQVNSIVGERLDRFKKSFYESLGVKNDEELNALVANAKSYLDTKEELNSLRQEKLFNSQGVKLEKSEDINFYFKGKGLDLNENNLKKELETHPEWKSEKVRVTPFGTQPDNKGDDKGEEEKAIASKMFGVKL